MESGQDGGRSVTHTCTHIHIYTHMTHMNTNVPRMGVTESLQPYNLAEAKQATGIRGDTWS